MVIADGDGLDPLGMLRRCLEMALGDAPAAHDGELDFGMIEAGVLITGFDIDDAEFIGDEFAFVVRIEDVDLGDRAGQVRAEDGVEKMDEQVTVVLGAQQGFEDTVGLGIDRVATIAFAPDIQTDFRVGAGLKPAPTSGNHVRRL